MSKGTAQHHQKAVTSILVDISNTSPFLGTGVDCKGFEEALLVVTPSILGGSSPSATVKWQESSDDGSSDTYADITGASHTALTDSNDDISAQENPFVGRLNLINRERYIRAHVTVTGTSPTGHVAAVVILSAAKERPVSQLQTVDFNIDTA